MGNAKTEIKIEFSVWNSHDGRSGDFLIVPHMDLHLDFDQKSSSEFNLLPACLLAAWFTGLTLATPFYYPYPRLVLPWLCSTWICIGLAFRSWSLTSTRPSSNRLFVVPLPVIIVAIATISILRLICGSALAWDDRSALQSSANEFAEAIKKGNEGGRAARERRLRLCAR